MSMRTLLRSVVVPAVVILASASLSTAAIAGTVASSPSPAAAASGSGSVAAGADAPAAHKAAANPRTILRKFDVDGNGSISAQEAVAIDRAIAEKPGRPIAVYDANDDGRLDEQELAALNARLAAFAAKQASAPDKSVKKAGKGAARTPALDCAAGTGTATVTWQRPSENVDDSPLKNLAGYVIRYGTSPRSLPCRAAVKDATATKYVVERLGVGTWYFSVAAVNREGVESPASDAVSKTIAR
jgi:hypothetical protein